ncbi:MAG: VWA domain-containing protein [Fuerstiella sp.]|jgi:Ca-activated chloride channel homolog
MLKSTACRPTIRQQSADRRGAILMLIVMCLPVILAFGAFAINVAWMQLTRTELRTATDASVRAGSRTLSITQDTDAARTAAVTAASKNTVAGTGLVLTATDVQFGKSSTDAAGKYSFAAQSETATTNNSVRVTGRRTAGSGSGAIPMLFAGVFDKGTFEPVKTAVATHIDRDVFLVLDRSGSMTTTTPGSSNRWLDLKKAVQAFLDTLAATPQDELVGVVTYSSTSTLDENMNLNYGQLMSTINGKPVSGATAIGLGLQDGIAGVTSLGYARPTAARTIVLMTDGIHNTGVYPDVVAATAAAQKITVHTITFSAGADQVLMKKVAQIGGGKHWHADDQAGLVAVFKEVANNLPTLITE